VALKLKISTPERANIAKIINENIMKREWKTNLSTRNFDPYLWAKFRTDEGTIPTIPSSIFKGGLSSEPSNSGETPTV
jgi:hypothetical protein